MSMTMTPPGMQYETQPAASVLRAKDYVASGTTRHVILGYMVWVLGFLVTLLATYGLSLIFWAIAGISGILGRKRARAQLHGSAIRVGPNQFPEIHYACARMAQQLGLKECPELYIIEDNTQNAAAIKRGRKHTIVLVDDIVFGAEATGNIRALEFVIAHELAHHALGHTKGLRRLVAATYKPVSRLDEFSCDAVACALVQDLAAAQDALCLLLAGPQLYRRVNREVLYQQAIEVMKDKYSKKSERYLTHPLLMRRYGRLLEIFSTGA